MLIRLLRAHVSPYRTDIALVIILQFLGTLATLYLPALNADIIDRGVVTGDTGHIVRVGGLMLAVTLVQIACSIAAVYFGARTASAMGRDDGPNSPASSNRLSKVRHGGTLHLRWPGR